MKIFKPKFWDENYLTFFSLLFFPFSFIYQIVLKFRNSSVKERSFEIPIICVGNIYIGGTGKTPLSIKLFKLFRDWGKNPIIVRKSYKDHTDEISLIKKYCKILTAKKRVEAVEIAIREKHDIIILDDGFQDLSIKKNLNIVCFNNQQKIGNGFTIPSGPLRESLGSLMRSDLVLINGKKDLQFEQKLKTYNDKLKFFYFDYFAKNLKEFQNKRVVAFAGIGNPENFFLFLKNNRINLIKEISFPDHYNYSEKDLDFLDKTQKENNAKLLTTEKDYLRINQIFRKKYNSVHIDVVLENDDLFKKEINKFLK